MTVIINPGAGPLVGAKRKHARKNVEEFATECGLRLSQDTPDDCGDGRWEFELKGARSPEGKRFRVKIAMPGLPLEQVRYMAAPGQDILKFPRICVNGSSYCWKNASELTRELLMDHIRGKPCR